MSEPQKKQLQIEIDDVTAQGAYCNMAFLSHSEQEFVLDFLFLSPQQQKAKVRSRIITSPKHAKRLMAALMDNIKKFESQFGEIPLETRPSSNNPPGGLYN